MEKSGLTAHTVPNAPGGAEAAKAARIEATMADSIVRSERDLFEETLTAALKGLRLGKMAKVQVVELSDEFALVVDRRHLLRYQGVGPKAISEFAGNLSELLGGAKVFFST